MANKLESTKLAVKDSLFDESKPWYKFFTWAEAQTGVSRLNLFIGIHFIIKYSSILICIKYFNKQNKLILCNI